MCISASNLAGDAWAAAKYASNISGDNSSAASNIMFVTSNYDVSASNYRVAACNITYTSSNIAMQTGQFMIDDIVNGYNIDVISALINTSNMCISASNLAGDAWAAAEYSSNMMKQWTFNHESNAQVNAGGLHSWYIGQDNMGQLVNLGQSFEVLESGLYCTDMFWSHDQNMFDISYQYDIVRERTWNGVTVFQFMEDSCFHCNPGDKIAIYASATSQTYAFNPESLWIITKK
jgi:hypothetical protein